MPGSQAVEMPRSKAPVLTLTRSEPADVKKTLQAALGELQLRWPRTVLVIDGLDLLLAASTVENAGSGVHDMLLGLREVRRADAMMQRAIDDADEREARLRDHTRRRGGRTPAKGAEDIAGARARVNDPQPCT